MIEFALYSTVQKQKVKRVLRNQCLCQVSGPAFYWHTSPSPGKENIVPAIIDTRSDEMTNWEFAEIFLDEPDSESHPPA